MKVHTHLFIGCEIQCLQNIYAKKSIKNYTTHESANHKIYTEKTQIISENALKWFQDCSKFNTYVNVDK